jgi:hypothetical protein
MNDWNDDGDEDTPNPYKPLQRYNDWDDDYDDE